MDAYATLSQAQRPRVSDGATVPLLAGTDADYADYILALVWPQLGDFDSLEYAWWIMRELEALRQQRIAVRAVGIGSLDSGRQFSDYTGFPAEWLFVDPTAQIHGELGLYGGVSVGFPGLSPGQKGWLSLMLMCAGLGSPGTLREVLRGYTGDRSAPQLFADDEVIDDTPLPTLRGRFFRWAGGSGFQRPFELATLRLRNMTEVLSHWSTYVPDAAYLPQRGATYLFDRSGQLVYEHCDRNVLGFSATMARPLSFLERSVAADTATSDAPR